MPAIIALPKTFKGKGIKRAKDLASIIVSVKPTNTPAPIKTNAIKLPPFITSAIKCTGAKKVRAANITPIVRDFAERTR